MAGYIGNKDGHLFCAWFPRVAESELLYYTDYTGIKLIKQDYLCGTNSADKNIIAGILMKIAGLNKTTLLDYPEKVAATVFTVGCNFCCPFCHNRDLVIGSGTALLSEESVLAFLEKRRRVLGGVCVTGGEPTIQPDLRQFVRAIKAMGYDVKLDTNGYRPEVISQLLGERLIDYIAMDIKNSKAKYGVTAAQPKLVFEPIAESIKLIKESGINYEFRTTVVKELHTRADIMEIGAGLGPGSKWFLQNYEENANVINKGYHSYLPEQLFLMAAELVSAGISAEVRGV